MIPSFYMSCQGQLLCLVHGHDTSSAAESSSLGNPCPQASAAARPGPAAGALAYPHPTPCSPAQPADHQPRPPVGGAAAHRKADRDARWSRPV